MTRDERIKELNAEMKRINDAFVEDKAATDFDYLTEYHNTMKVLSDELLVLLKNQEDDMKGEL